MKLKTILLALLVGAAACDDVSTTPPNASVNNEEISAVWRFSTGNFLENGDNRLEYLVLGQDGRGEAYYRHTDTDGLICDRLVFSVLTESTFTLDIWGSYSTTYFYTRDGIALSVTDSDGNLSQFTEATEVPAEFLCKSFSDVTTVATDLAPPPQQNQNLVFDGTFLWYGVQGADHQILQKVDPGTGEIVGTTDWVGAFNYHYIQSEQGGDFWAYGNTSMSRRTIADVEVDNVNTAAPPINKSTSVFAVTFDGSFLWLFGRNETSFTNQFLKIDSNAEPDTLVTSFEYPESVRAIAGDGTSIWILASTDPAMVYRFNPGTQKVIASYEVPDENLNYSGIALDGSDLLLLATDDTSVPRYGVIFRVTP